MLIFSPLYIPAPRFCISLNGNIGTVISQVFSISYKIYCAIVWRIFMSYEPS